MAERKVEKPGKCATYEGDVETFWGYGAHLWSVARVTSDGGCEVVAHGEAKNMHGAKSVIAKICKRFEQQDRIALAAGKKRKNDGR